MKGLRKPACYTPMNRGYTALLRTLILLCSMVAAVAAQGQTSSKQQRDTSQQQRIVQPPSKTAQAQPQMSIEQLRQQLLRARPEMFGPKVVNPNTVRARDTMISLFRQQQQAAITERTVILATHRSASMQMQIHGQSSPPQTKD